MIESQIDRGRVVTIKVEQSEEWALPFYGTIFSVHASRDGGATWKRVLTFRHDDVSLSVRYATVTRSTDELVAVYMGWTYVLTRDGGVTWTRWDATKDLPNWVCCNYGLIQRLEFQPDGTGVLQMDVIDPARNEFPEMVTRDFGATWKVGRR